MNGTEIREEAAVALALSVAVTIISSVGLLVNAYILFVIVITKQVQSKQYVPPRHQFQMPDRSEFQLPKPSGRDQNYDVDYEDKLTLRYAVPPISIGQKDMWFNPGTTLKPDRSLRIATNVFEFPKPFTVKTRKIPKFTRKTTTTQLASSTTEIALPNFIAKISNKDEIEESTPIVVPDNTEIVEYVDNYN